MNLYVESIEKSEYARREYSNGIIKLTELDFSEFSKKNTPGYLCEALGFPLDREINEPCSMSHEFVGSDDICEIFRLRICTLSTLPFFGLLFVPKRIKSTSPLIVAAHGHLGTPELMYGMHGKNGYNQIISRIIEKGICVFAPQFLLWNCGISPAKPHYKTKYDRISIDEKLKKCGSSITSVEIFCLLRAIDTLTSQPFLDAERVGVCGMSYGAFLTLRAMAVSEKIKCGYFMSCSNGGLDERFPEWFFRNPYKTPRDGEILGLCSPRPVFVEVGEFDDIFPVSQARKEAVFASSFYENCKSANNFVFSVWNGGHVVNPKSLGVSFLCETLSNLKTS